MNYAETLNDTQKKYAELIIKTMNKKGITNPFAQASILAIASKESNLSPTANETDYSHTSNARIRDIFSKTKELSEEKLTRLKTFKKVFFNFVYSDLGGYKYRGRGFNQLTGKDNYKMIGDLLHLDLVNSPDLVSENLEVAINVLIEYFLITTNALSKNGKLEKYYNANNINDFNNLVDSTGAIYHANAGTGYSLETLKKDVTGGRKKAFSRVQSIYDTFVKGGAVAPEKKNKLPLILLVIATLFFAYKNVK